MPIQFIVLISVLSLWLLIDTFIIIRLSSHYQSLTKGVSTKDLISSLNHFISKVQQNQSDLNSLQDKLEKEIQVSRLHLQKFYIKRYNPFKDTGGDQSFILCLLDENDDGFVVSSLHSRENTRVYAKAIVRGNCSDQALSKDELEVIKKAQNKV